MTLDKKFRKDKGTIKDHKGIIKDQKGTISIDP